MKMIGILLIIIGLASLGLHYFHMEPKQMMVIDTWGPTVGWAIRGGVTALGFIFFLIGNSQEARG